MEYTQLGKSDLIISRISMGCMSLGHNDQENAAIILSAYEHGVNFFDTADLYEKGLNEETVGRALKSVRNKVMIATKVGNQWRGDGSGWDWNPTKKYITEAVEKSLTRLQTDHIDLYQVHGGTIEDPIDETIEAFETLKQQGKIRYYGISSIRPNVIHEYVKRSNIVSVMMQYSLLDRRPEEECLSLLYEKHIGVLVRGSLASGLLIDKPAKPYLNYSTEEVAQSAKAISAIANSSQSKTSVALRYVLGHNAVSSAVVGVRTQQQLQDIIAADVNEPLSADALKTLRSFTQANRYTDHR
jgi:aryl-alcohol dehydrogenase-like predicted oxidoreductase